MIKNSVKIISKIDKKNLINPETLLFNMVCHPLKIVKYFQN